MTSERRFYTYAYLREDRTPYYIGKGSGKRAFENEGRTCKRPPKERILLLKQNLTEEEAFRHEIYMIAIFGRKDLGTGILRNLTAGGDGVSGYIVTEKRRKQISETTRGVPKTKEHRQKIKEALLRKAANKGKTWCYNPDNPTEEKLCLPQDIPQGWVKGRVIPEEVKQKSRKPKRLDPIREKKRKEFLSLTFSNRRWFHSPEGDTEKLCHEGNQPEGWVLGRKVR
jgi:hypothetical protein